MAYIPISPASQVTSINEQKVEQIPTYEDSGIKYQGKYKTLQAQNSYSLKNQQTRFYALGTAALGLTTFTRANKENTIFYCTKAVVYLFASTTGINNYDTLFDVVGAVNSPRAYFWGTGVGTFVQIFDFTDCPRQFKGDFGINKTTSGATNFTIMELFGWEEQI